MGYGPPMLSVSSLGSLAAVLVASPLPLPSHLPPLAGHNVDCPPLVVSAVGFFPEAAALAIVVAAVAGLDELPLPPFCKCDALPICQLVPPSLCCGSRSFKV